MPIYEFFCTGCDTIYKFFSRSVNTEKIPSCPKCANARLERRVSMFASISGRKEGESDAGGGLPMDEAKMEKAMAMLAGEAEKISEDDPRQAAALMRKLTEATGLSMGPRMEEALSRLERGDDPDAIETEMGDLMGDEDLFLPGAGGKKGARESWPRVDETLYDL